MKYIALVNVGKIKAGDEVEVVSLKKEYVQIVSAKVREKTDVHAFLFDEFFKRVK